MKQTFLTTILVLIFTFFIPSYFLQIASQSINIEKKVVPYQLPYPGILPGHPLYFLKELRDEVLLFTSRDNLKKAKLYLHLSDKNIAIAKVLIESGKEQTAVDQLIIGEERFQKIIPTLLELKKQGGAYPYDLVIKIQQSNQKHREVITEVLGKVTESKATTVNTLLKLNTESEILIRKLE